MSQLHSVSSVDPFLADPLTLAQREVLHRAVAKLVLLGARVGISVDQMILLLDSGLTVGELLDYIAFKEAESA